MAPKNIFKTLVVALVICNNWIQIADNHLGCRRKYRKLKFPSDFP